MGNRAVDDEHAFDTGFDGVSAALDFGDHAAGNDAVIFQLTSLFEGDFREQRIGIVLIFEDAIDIGHGKHTFRIEGAGNLGRCRIGVDVVGLTVGVGADSRNDRDIAFVQVILDNGNVDVRNAADIAQFIALLLDFDHLVIQTAEADSLAANRPDKVDQILVYLAGQDHLDDFHRFCIGHAQAVEELRFHAQAVQRFLDMRAAAVDQDDFDADEVQEDDIAHDRFLQVFIDHGVAAVLDDDDFAAVFLDVRQSVHQNLCLLGIGYGFDIFRDKFDSFKHRNRFPHLTASFQRILKA